MRLIDADAIKCDGDCQHCQFFKGYDIDGGCEILEMPTAYDVDKVVSLLEAKKNIRIAEVFGRRSGKSLCVGYAQGHQDAIDIVKRGGVDDSASM